MNVHQAAAGLPTMPALAAEQQRQLQPIAQAPGRLNELELGHANELEPLQPQHRLVALGRQSQRETSSSG